MATVHFFGKAPVERINFDLEGNVTPMLPMKGVMLRLGSPEETVDLDVPPAPLSLVFHPDTAMEIAVALYQQALAQKETWRSPQVWRQLAAAPPRFPSAFSPWPFSPLVRILPDLNPFGHSRIFCLQPKPRILTSLPQPFPGEPAVSGRLIWEWLQRPGIRRAGTLAETQDEKESFGNSGLKNKVSLFSVSEGYFVGWHWLRAPLLKPLSAFNAA